MINFESISDIIHNKFDIDLMDIKRKGIEIYSNIPCNIQINQADNPDPTAVDVTPIVSSLTVHMPNYIDIQNNDYIVAKRMSYDNKILEVYSGVCGFPAVWQARKSVNMAMNTLSGEGEVTPPPPIEKSVININYKDLVGNTIKPATIRTVEVDKPVDIFPPPIDNYSFKNSYLDGVLQPDNIVSILSPSVQGHNVLFQYETTNDIEYFRILVKGVYTKDNGATTYGLHLFKKIPILSVAGRDGVYTITTTSNKIFHDEVGEITLKIGTKLKIYNTNEWVSIYSEPVKIDGYYEFSTVPYIPTLDEEKAYVTNWYEVSI